MYELYMVKIYTHGESTSKDDGGENEDNNRCSSQHFHYLSDKALSPEASQNRNQYQIQSCQNKHPKVTSFAKDVFGLGLDFCLNHYMTQKSVFS
jgi:hypothetical protein